MNETDEFYNFESPYYDAIYGSFNKDILFYESLGTPSPILELFAGTGRIISKLGNGVGLERNINMLKQGDNEFMRVQGDARKLPFKEFFNTVIIGLNSLLLLPNEEKRTAIREAKRVMRRNGFLFVDVINGFSLGNRTYIINHHEDESLDVSLKVRSRRKGDQYQLRYSYLFARPKPRFVRKKVTIYPIEFKQLEEMLYLENLSVDKVYGDYDLSPLSDKSEKIIIRAKQA